MSISFFLDEKKNYKINVDEKSLQINNNECFACKSKTKEASFKCIVYDYNLNREVVCDNCWVYVSGCGECVCEEKNKDEYLLCKIDNDKNLKIPSDKLPENEWQFLHYYLYGDGKKYFSGLLLK
jgi:hypothetical protein